MFSLLHVINCLKSAIYTCHIWRYLTINHKEFYISLPIAIEPLFHILSQMKKKTIKRMRKLVIYLMTYLWDTYRTWQLCNVHPSYHPQGGQTGDVLYEASGTSEDYIHNAGVKYAYTIELPRYSFILDPSNIVPLSKAVWRTLVCTIGLIAKNESVLAFCKKKIVKVQLKNGQTVSGWFDKNLPLDEAEQFIMERYNTTERNTGKYDGKRNLFLYDLRWRIDGDSWDEYIDCRV